MLRSLFFLFPYLFCLAFAQTGAAQDSDYYPTVSNGKGKDTQQFPMGPIGGTMEVQFGTSEAKIVDLSPHGPGAMGGLKIDDVLIGVNDAPFTPYSKASDAGGDGLPYHLGLAILKSQSIGTPLELVIKRDGKKQAVRIAFTRLADFPADEELTIESFQDSKRYTQLLELSANWLARAQNSQGAFSKKKGAYSNAFAALALLSTGDKRYRRRPKLTADRFVAECSEQVPSSNWHTTAIGIYLSEYYLATGDESVKPAIKACCDAVAKRLAPETGRLGHNGGKLPYGGKALLITSAHAHLMWALAEHAGIQTEKGVWDLSYKSVAAGIGKKGNVGYNLSVRGSYQSMARTGCMATALLLAGKNEKDLQGMNQWMEANYKRCGNCHAVASMGYIFGFAGLKNCSPEACGQNLSYYRWMYALVQPYDESHGAYYIGKRGNFAGDGYLNQRVVANYVTVLTLCSVKTNTLWSFGNRTKSWLRE